MSGAMKRPSRKTRVVVDPITAQVIRGRLDNACMEAGDKLQRMAFSQIIRESRDYGVALVDARGRHIAETKTTPPKLTSMVICARGVLQMVKELGDTIEEGDVWLHNDPYHGASHAPDISVMIPAFHKGELVGFGLSQAHMIDTGGSKPGSSSIDAVDVYAESQRLRAIKIVHHGEWNRVLWRYIQDNVRAPDMVSRDLEAMLAAAQLAALRYTEIIEEFGKETMEAANNWLADYSERMLREAIAKLPDGVYTAENYCDGYPAEEDPRKKNIKAVVTLTIKGSDITVDLSGSSPQVPDRCVNVPFEGTAVPCIMVVIRTLLLDEASHGFIPQNDGIMRPIRILVPPLGSIFNPTFPSATIARWHTTQSLANALVKAFAQAAPHLVPASCAHVVAFVHAGIARSGFHWIFFDLADSSFGAMDDLDGYDAMDSLFINTRNTPIEDIETHFPLRILESQLRPHEPAPGKHRGGLGTQRTLMYLEPGWVSSEADNTVHPLGGLFGGHSGKVTEIWVNPGSENSRRLDSKFTGLPMQAGDTLRCVTASSGGYGSPLERDPERVLADYRAGLVSLDGARRDYGVVINARSRMVNLAETQHLRAQLLVVS